MMSKLKNVFRALLAPPPWCMLTLSLFCAVMLIGISVRGITGAPIAYLVYILSGYVLLSALFFCVRTLPGKVKKTKQRVYDHPLGNRYLTDHAFKEQIRLYCNLTLNVLYAAYKFLSGILYESFWLGAVGVYYILLSLLRFLLLSFMRGGEGKADIIDEYRRCRLCGMVLLGLNLSLCGIVFQMAWQNKSYDYPGSLIFIVAAYSFWLVANAAIDLLKHRAYNSPILSVSQAIRLVAALVSMLSLITAMLVRFVADASLRREMIVVMGAGVCLFVLGISVYMLVSSGREIRLLRREENRREMSAEGSTPEL